MASSDAPALGAPTAIDEEAQMELVKEVKLAAWLKDQVSQEIVRSILGFSDVIRLLVTRI